MPQLILVMTLMVTLSNGETRVGSQGRWVLPPPVIPTIPGTANPATHGKDETTEHLTVPCFPYCKVTSTSQSSSGYPEKDQTQEGIPVILPADISMVTNTMNLVKKRNVIPSSDEIHGRDLQSQADTDSANEIKNTSKKIYALNAVLQKGDFAIPYDSLGWFSKAVEAALDGSLYIGLALGIMFISASVLSGAIGVFGDTCLICSFIGHATVKS